jgi:hypothetical protein
MATRFTDDPADYRGLRDISGQDDQRPEHSTRQENDLQTVQWGQPFTSDFGGDL